MSNLQLPDFLKSQDEIRKGIISNIERYPSLSGLKTQSKVSVIGAIIDSMAQSIYEEQFSLYQAYLNAIDGVNWQQVSTKQWYIDKTLEFQFGENPTYLGSGRYGYATVDPSKQVVQRVSVTGFIGTTTEPIINIRANKIIGGIVVPLTDTELESLKAYWRLIDVIPSFVSMYDNTGEYIDSRIFSYIGDDLRMSLQVILNSQIINVEDGKNIITGKEVVRDFVEDFTNNLWTTENVGFNGEFSLSKLITGIMEIEGIVSVAIGLCEAKADDEIIWKNVLDLPYQVYETKAGYFKPMQNDNLIIEYKGYEYE